MKIFRMTFANRHKEKYETYISKDEYKNLMAYARDKNVKLEGFRKYIGDISFIKELVDDIVDIAEDFPRILTDRRSVVLRYDEHLQAQDFATTKRHLISINSKIFNDRRYLENEYRMLAEMGFFVKGSSFRSIIRHEVGHVVANIYNLDPMCIAKEVLKVDDENEIQEFIMNNLSLYAAEYSKGIEIISESFSAYYSGIDNYFAKAYVNKCKDLVREEDV